MAEQNELTINPERISDRFPLFPMIEFSNNMTADALSAPKKEKILTPCIPKKVGMPIIIEETAPKLAPEEIPSR